MMLLIGQPVWQNGMPQSMQRAPCVEASSSVSAKMNSRELRTRSAIGSVVSATRLSSMKPVILPIMTLPRRSRRRLLLLLRGGSLRHGLRCMHLGKRAPVFVREHLDELATLVVPVVEHRERVRAAREAQVALDQLAQRRFIGAARMAHPS